MSTRDLLPMTERNTALFPAIGTPQQDQIKDTYGHIKERGKGGGRERDREREIKRERTCMGHYLRANQRRLAQ